MPRVRLVRCVDVKRVCEEIARFCNLGYIDFSMVEFVASSSTSARAYARIFGLPRQIQVAHNLPPLYTIEFICANLTGLSPEGICRVLIHELLHIPYKLSGGLRQHGRIVNDYNARVLSSKVPSELKVRLKNEVIKCCRALMDF